jgi:MATE family multidrug resistance protein
LRFGLPNGVQYFVDVICYAIFIQLVGKIGALELKATALAFNLSTLTFMPLLGLGTAVMVLTGQRIGEGRPELAVRTTWYAFGLGLANVLFFGLIYVLAPDTFLQFYQWGAKAGEMEAVGPHVKRLLVFVACYSCFDAMALIFSSTTRGAGDTLFAVTFTITAGIVCLVLPTWAVFSYGLGLTAAWFAVTAFILVLGVGFLLRFMQGRWKQMRVIETVEA